MNHQKPEKNAGGMSYRTLPGIETTLITHYLDYTDKKPLSIVFEKNKEYYMASADKTIARLELAKSRVENSAISYDECQFVMKRISHGLNCMLYIKNRIKNVSSSEELHRITPYKIWHAVKLIPQAAEGYTILISIEEIIFTSERLKSDRVKLKNVKFHLKKAKKIFMSLLVLDENSDFQTAEKSRLKAYEEIKTVEERGDI
ncbi:hypothetical protein [uncultured Methanobacterium sp.]|uniref:hypothetical protein n=1 Tax=uncultured Methanobacterium sp. TaxID=176306 RepID=UPI002AA75BB6|nr:hypothetical protein [uncultured Methanobacterium sp.]